MTPNDIDKCGKEILYDCYDDMIKGDMIKSKELKEPIKCEIIYIDEYESIKIYL